MYKVTNTLPVFMLVLILNSFNIRAQSGRQFWFAAPDISAAHGNNGIPLSFHISALGQTNVRISRPADSTFTPVNLSLPADSTASILISNLLRIDSIECDARLGLQSNGFLIEADSADITVFYEMNNRVNKEIITLKGENALGSRFTITTQNIFDNWIRVRARSGFAVVATRPNTRVVVNLPVNYVGLPIGTDTIVLARTGETYAFEPDSNIAAFHPQGIPLYTYGPDSNEEYPVAVTIYDDSMSRDSLYGMGVCRDAFADQIVPEKYFGQEYMVLRGWLQTRAEFAFITAILDSTQIFINNVQDTIINAGDVLPRLITNRITRIKGSNPITVNHITGFGCEQGGAILPSIDQCTGSFDVFGVRTITQGQRESFFLNLIVRNDTVMGSPTRNQAINNFSISVNQIMTPIPATFFRYTLPDSTFAYLIDDSNTNGPVYAFIDSITRVQPRTQSTSFQVTNRTSRFHLGLVQGHRVLGCKYGYFSSYAISEPSVGAGGSVNSNRIEMCELDTIRLNVRGGTNYEWSCTSHPELTNKISNVHVPSPYFVPEKPDSYKFNVKITGNCSEETVLSTEVLVYSRLEINFTVDESEGCSPFKTAIINTSPENPNESYSWEFISPFDTSGSDTLPKSFSKTFINESDTLQTTYIRLMAQSKYKICNKSIEKTVTIGPPTTASFESLPSKGLSPLEVSFTNESGRADFYNWDFGDGTTSVIENPKHTFISETKKEFQVRLIASGENCKDTAYKSITILHPNSSISTLTQHSFNGKVYYNANNRKLVIDCTIQTISDLWVSVYNLLGAKVLDKEVENVPAGSYKDEISFENKRDGIYILQLHIGDKQMIIQKFIKN